MDWLIGSRLKSWIGLWVAMGMVGAAGCRSTVTITDTSETASAQLLLTSTVDAVVCSFDFSPLAGRLCYLETRGLGGSGKEYVAYRIREAMGGCGVRLADSREAADVVVEAGMAVYGTDSYKSTLGVAEAIQLPDVTLCVRYTQFGVSKLSLFAVERESGTIIWNSGSMRADSRQDVRNAFGTGPRFSGTIDHPAHRVHNTEGGVFATGASWLGLD